MQNSGFLWTLPMHMAITLSRALVLIYSKEVLNVPKSW